jgi:hypothetical protein
MVIAGVVLSAATVPGARAQQHEAQYGFVTFPKDEHQHIDGWDYWWGAADLGTASGNRYTVGIAFDSFNGYGATGHQVFPRQGPYKGKSIMTMDGPAEWGHPGEVPGQFVREISTYVPGYSDLLSYHTLDTLHGMKDIGSWERTSLERETYRLRLDDDAAKVHPSGKAVKLVVDVRAEMRSPPLLLGGSGRWWYGIPDSFGYPSRSFQYMQSASRLTGVLELQQPNGSLLKETVVSSKSTLVMVHEYDATPEDLFAGLALAESTQLHPRYANYYGGGMPWDLIFVDLRNGAQLMLAVLAFQDSNKGTLTSVVGERPPTYRAMATLRLPTGESIPLERDLRVEHLSYRTIVGHVPTFQVQVNGIWTQDWDYRVSYGGGTVKAPDGKRVRIPAFDLGLLPQFATSEPAQDDRGNGLTQRVPFLALGSYGGCPVHGFGWSELIINWYGHRDPWFTGRAAPTVPSRCEKPEQIAGPHKVVSHHEQMSLPNVAPEGCGASNPGSAPICSYKANTPAGVAGYGSEPGGWTVTIKRRSLPDPIVIRSFGGSETYACGTVRPGDRVVAKAQPGSSVSVGNPGICY